MIPNEHEIKQLWDKYFLPENKRLHVTLVTQAALFLAQKLSQATGQSFNLDLLRAGGLLHDIDKNAPKLPEEKHPDSAVRILREEGMPEVAQLVKTHPLHAILDPQIIPKTWEEKLLFLADKMVKSEIMTVDKRFALWNAEKLPVAEQTILDAAYPKVKAWEKEIFAQLGIKPEAVAKLA